MSSFFKEIANGAVNLEESMLGPDYKYYNYIRSPGQLGVTGDGNMDAMAKDIAGIINYVELLVSGGGPASKTGEALGPKFYLKTAGKCKDVATNKVVPRYIYIDNVPDGNIPLISSGLGVNFTEFEGLLPGILEDAGALNPMSMFSAFQQGATPDCKEVNFPVQGDDRTNHPTSGHVAVAEINEYNAVRNRTEGFLSGNRMLRGEKRKKKSKKQVPPFANVYLTGFGVLLVYLMYRMIHKK
jgi:hypothetical protein